MGDMAEPITGGVTKLVGGALQGKHERQLTRAQINAAEKLARLQLQGAKDMERERFARERELWSKAMGAYSGFSQAPTLQGRSQMDTPYTQINSPGTGYNYPEDVNGNGRVPQ